MTLFSRHCLGVSLGISLGVAIGLAVLLKVSGQAWALDGAPHRGPDMLADMLPDAVVVRGTNDIQSAWLVEPTTRYVHGAMADRIEAGGVRVQLRNGAVVGLSLPPQAVFEDRYPRLADLDGDGRDEMILVKSTQTQGAALVLVGLRDGALKILAETQPIGQPQRWLNPAGVGDFDGDGQVDVAYVETPHIGGILRIVKWQGKRLVQLYQRSGFSNHAIGTSELELSATRDVNADGVMDLVIPDNLRTRLKAVTFKGGFFKVLSSMALKAPLQKLQTQPSGALQAVLDDATTVAVRF